jgi:hypothetical protein
MSMAVHPAHHRCRGRRYVESDQLLAIARQAADCAGVVSRAVATLRVHQVGPGWRGLTRARVEQDTWQSCGELDQIIIALHQVEADALRQWRTLVILRQGGEARG